MLVSVLVLASACELPDPSKYTDPSSCVQAGFEWEADEDFPQGHCEAD